MLTFHSVEMFHCQPASYIDTPLKVTATDDVYRENINSFMKNIDNSIAAISTGKFITIFL